MLFVAVTDCLQLCVVGCCCVAVVARCVRRVVCFRSPFVPCGCGASLLFVVCHCWLLLYVIVWLFVVLLAMLFNGVCCCLSVGA